MATQKTKSELESELKQKDSALVAMQEKIELLMQQMSELSTHKNDSANSNIDNIMLANEKIKVISLIDYPLYLSTEEYGTGKKYSFPHYGYEHNIKFNDLEDIVHLTRSFAEKGIYYITDRQVVEELGLEDAYKTILDKDKIDLILNLESELAVSLFAGANREIQESLVDMMIVKINEENKVYDLNLLEKINTIYGKDIKKIAEDSKELKK